MLFRRTVLASFAALALLPLAASAAELPDLGGKSVVVVTENA
ncbi:basic amino acid ABC transporter substrate-binding protein, partial [Rhizobium ruizarguesonis]